MVGVLEIKNHVGKIFYRIEYTSGGESCFDQADVLNFFAKYNYEIVNSNTQSEGGVIINNMVFSDNSISLTFVNNN